MSRSERFEFFHVSFIMSKSRVAPLKSKLTIPRLELEAAVLAVRLAKLIEEENVRLNNLGQPQLRVA